MKAGFEIHERAGVVLITVLVAATFLTSCKRNMYEEPKFLPDQQNYYFPREAADRQPVAHTVARGPIDDGSPFYTGEMNGALATNFPMTVTPQLVARGQEAFEINCSACHGRDGYGQGMVVQRGFPAPPSFHTDRLRNAPVGHFFEVITHGYGIMYPFGSRVSPEDRWAIISYICALQLSQHAPASELAPEDESKLREMK